MKPPSTAHEVLASSFADIADVRAFNRCKSEGKSDQECFKIGDNGLGCWGDITAQEKVAMCALPPDDMIEEWGTLDKARGREVIVRANDREMMCVLADRMPWRKNIKNGCGIDLNPACAKALGLRPPFKVRAVWWWA